MGFFEGFQYKVVQTSGTEINVAVGGSGFPVLLLHGYPQSHLMWHKVAPILAKNYTIIASDLRGYGDSGKPPAGEDHSGYSKRSSAMDQVEVMLELGYEKFHIVGHDRGARVGRRLALDYPSMVGKLISLDVVPTSQIFDSIDKSAAEAYFHWFLMMQPEPLAETLISNSAEFYLDWILKRWCSTPGSIPQKVFNEYLRCFLEPRAIHCMCEDYRAVIVDLEHDREDATNKLNCPVLALWGSRQTHRPGWPSMHLDVLVEWRKCADLVDGWSIDCGHFLPEEAPLETAGAIERFLG